MHAKSIRIWLIVAAALGLVLIFNSHFKTNRPYAPPKVLPGLRADAVHAIQMRPQGQEEIQLQRTAGRWQLVKPIPYPARTEAVEYLLKSLEELIATAFISPAELRERPLAYEEYGLNRPQTSLILEQDGFKAHLLVGARTAPGDQFFLQVVGSEGVHVIDSALLSLLPNTANDLRDTTFVNLQALDFNRISVTSGGRHFAAEHQASTGLWRLISPIPARAHHARIEQLLEQLNALRVLRFVTDSTNVEWDAFGLQSPEFEISLNRGTNVSAQLRFGRSPTNEPSHVFAMVAGRTSVVTVSKDLVAPWRGDVNDFRDPHLVLLREPVTQIDVTSSTPFSLRKETNNNWIVYPEKFEADAELVDELLRQLGGMRIVEFTKTVVTPIDLPTYGLASPWLSIALATNASSNATTTNRTIVELNFGTNVNDRVFIRRSDEASVYAVSAHDVSSLPTSGAQMRQRQIWKLSEDMVLGVTIKSKGKTRQLIRQGAHQWELAPGSQGIINEAGVEESVRPLCQLRAAAWVARGAEHRPEYGFSEDGHQLTLDLKNGKKFTIEFGALTRNESVYAGVTLDDSFWIFTLSPSVYRFVITYLSVPGSML